MRGTLTTSSSPKNVTLVTSKGISRHILSTCKCRFLVVRPVESPITLAGLASNWPTILQAAVQSKRPSSSHTVIFIMSVQMECPGMPPVHPALHAPVPAEAQGRARQSTARLDKISDKIRHATHFCSLNARRREIWPHTATPRKMPAAIRQAAHPRPREMQADTSTAARLHPGTRQTASAPRSGFKRRGAEAQFRASRPISRRIMSLLSS